MAGSDLTRGQLSLDFARNRLAEAAALPGDNTAFAGVLDDMDNDTKQGVRLLTGSAVARKDKTPLSTVDSFVGAQRARMAPVMEALSTANRRRATESLTLLDIVHQRAEDLRAGLACGTVAPDGTDTLGPRLDDCITGSDNSSPAQHQQGSSEKQQAKPSESSARTTKVKPTPTGAGLRTGLGTGTVTGTDEAEPSVSPKAKAPRGGNDNTGEVVPSGDDVLPDVTSDPATSIPTDDDGSTDQDTNPLGGLLGNIFGS
jgi:hypothetical protein